MKRRRVERVERRRPPVELNLIGGEAKKRSVTGPRGCLPLLGRLFLGTLVLVLLWLGPH
jgi:hypothetical protein